MCCLNAASDGGSLRREESFDKANFTLSFSMSILLDKFCSFLPPNIASKYTTSKLQQKLLNYFGNAIIVEKQRGQGKSNTVFNIH
jgi:hypothetical protein